MNVTQLLVQVFKPAQAARAAAQARIANVPGCEKTPLLALVRCVNDARTLRGDISTSIAARQLAAHVHGQCTLSPTQIVNKVRAVKHEQRDILHALMKRSAGVHAGSDRAQEIAATRAALESARRFNGSVRLAAPPAPAGQP